MASLIETYYAHAQLSDAAYALLARRKGDRLTFYPTQGGIFVVNRHSKSDREPGNAGEYLVQGTVVKKVVSGVLTDISAVSPDGCRIAFSHAPSQDSDRFDPKNHRRLKMIDICEKGAKS